MDDEGTKCMKQMITLFTITGQFIPQNRCQSERLRKILKNMDGQQMLIASLASSNGFTSHQNNKETKA